MLRIVLILVLCVALCRGEYEDPAVWRTACVPASELYTLAVDSCQVHFDVTSSGNSVAERYELYAVNADCDDCAPTLVLSSTDSTSCARLWTPFEWTFTVVDTFNGATMTPALTTLLGERGSYDMTATLASGVNPPLMALTAVVLEEPEDSLKALWIWLFIIFLPIIVLNFVGAPVALWLRKQLRADPADGAYVTSPTPDHKGHATNSPGRGGSFWEALMSPATMAGLTWRDNGSMDGGAVSPKGADSANGGGALNTPLLLRSVGGIENPSASSPRSALALATPTTPTTPATGGGGDSTTPTPKPPSARVDCLDTFRGACLLFMIFVNYGGGGYWFFDHAAWNGLTFADLLFPWFMWVMGCSMALSYRRLHSSEFRGSEVDAYERPVAKGARMGLGNDVDEEEAATPLGKRYAVSEVQEGSSKGWSTLESLPSSPNKLTPTHSAPSDQQKEALLSAKEAGPSEGGKSSKEDGTAGGDDAAPAGEARPEEPCAKGPGAEQPWPLWRRVLRRCAILFGLGLFLNNGYQVFSTGEFRIPGVLQYFAISTLVVAGTVLACRERVARALAAYEDTMMQTGRLPRARVPPPVVVAATAAAPGNSEAAAAWYDARDSVLACYASEYWAMGALWLFYVIICLGVPAPGCPTGYNGPGGIANSGTTPDCTGGIHRYIDVSLLGESKIYDGPTCTSLYGCQTYDPEGLLGSLTACTLSYLGLMTGRVLLHYPGHAARLRLWLCGGTALCLLGACLCGFSQNDGLIPVNKNLWSASFGVLLAGGGMICLAITYYLVDMHKLWTGAPFRYLGLNSILLFVGHELLQGNFPFSWEVTYPTHMSLMAQDIIGAALWALIARYCYAIKFFVKV